MIPILYDSLFRGGSQHLSVPDDYGLGALDCISCSVTEERNGIYELEMEYPANGRLADSIAPFRFIKAKPNLTDDPQIFEIYKVGKNINGKFTINAHHISYRLSNMLITSGSANNVVSAVSMLQGATISTEQFLIQTTKNTQGDFVITEPSSIRSWFGGKQGSLLDVYGGGEWYYDNLTATLMEHRGENKGVQIRYGKNLTELSQEIDMTNLAGSILPYYKDPEGNVTTGTAVSTGVDISKEIAVDFSQDVDPEADIIPQLEVLATSYVTNHNFTTMLNNITLDFVQLADYQESIALCDTVTVIFEPLGISASAKCIETVWDVLEERFTKITLGDPKPSITDTIQDTINAASTADNKAHIAITEAGEKRRVFTDTPVPPYDVGDLWVNGNDMYYCINPKTVTITGHATSGTYGPASFNTPLAEPLLECICHLNGDSEGYDSVTITHTGGTPQSTVTYVIELGQPITTGGELNVLEGVLTLPDESVIEVTPVTITTFVGDNYFRSTHGNIDIEYLIEGFQMSDWNRATDYVSPSRLEDAINASTALITGNSGGYVVIHDSNGDKKPDEILIMDNENIRDALKVWRWNAGGLGYSSTGYNGPFSPAIDSEGRIVADMITTGSLDALKVTVEHLTATMFEGGKITLGGLNNQSGVLELKDESGLVIGELTKQGLKFYGAGPEGARPYVVLNNSDGFKGYDANGNAIFWVNRDEFNMKKCVAENEINACGMLKMLPMTIEQSGTVVNRGLAFIAIV